MFDEDEVPGDGGAAYDVAEHAVEYHDMGQAAVFGYSHGGGSAQELCLNLPALDVDVPFVGYIDAVEQPNWTQENQRPICDFLINLYQETEFGDPGFPAEGGPVSDLKHTDEEIHLEEDTIWGVNATHLDIDDFFQLHDLIIAEILDRVIR